MANMPGGVAECQATLRPHFQTGANGLVDILERLLLGLALTYAAGNRRTLGDPHSVFIAIESDSEFHGANPRMREPSRNGKFGLRPPRPACFSGAPIAGG